MLGTLLVKLHDRLLLEIAYKVLPDSNFLAHRNLDPVIGQEVLDGRRTKVLAKRVLRPLDIAFEKRNVLRIIIILVEFRVGLLLLLLNWRMRTLTIQDIAQLLVEIHVQVEIVLGEICLEYCGDVYPISLNVQLIHALAQLLHILVKQLKKINYMKIVFR